jgi:hypothetical protein
MAKRLRNCPTTGVLKSAVDKPLLNPGRTAVDIGQLKEDYPDCNLFGDTMIVDQIPPLSLRSFRRRLQPLPDGTPSSYYHLRKIPLGKDGNSAYINATHVDSLDYGSKAYDADAVARRTAKQRELRSGTKSNGQECPTNNYFWLGTK